MVLVALALLAACGSVPFSEPTVTPIATVAPNARALPSETTLVEAAPSIATTEAQETAPPDDAAPTPTDATAPAADEQAADTPVPGTATPEMPEVRVDELLSYMQQSVAVRGTIVELVGEHAFVIQDSVLLDEEPVLVIYDQADFSLAEGQSVLVGGEVRPFDLAALEDQTGLDLEDAPIQANRTDPVLVADSITRAP